MEVSADCEFMDASVNKDHPGTGLQALNAALSEEALTSLLACCGSIKWAQRMVQSRPFIDPASLYRVSERIWWDLRPDDWLEAFASHPKIGERKAAQNRSVRSSEWSAQEQAGTHGTASEVLSALADANRAYQDRFGYIFIVCATGKTAEEMLALCRQRLNNDPNAEFIIAAEEQRKITEIRLKKLIESA
jgi:2-oxo-4-hydroxy-4-carboxy-5-ureidoimidazoline decarboxylase